MSSSYFLTTLSIVGKVTSSCSTAGRTIVLLAAVAPMIGGRASADVLYASNWGYGNLVSKIPAGGAATTFASNLPDAEGLAFDTAGNLYVALQQTSQIDKVTPAGVVSTFATNLTGEVGGLAIDKSGNLFAAIQPGGSGTVPEVDKITATGAVSVFTTGLPGGAPAGAQGLAFDSSGNLFVSDDDANEVLKINSAGIFSVFATGLDLPAGLAFDRSGNLYVGNYGNSTVSEITPAGIASTFATVPNGVWGLTFDTTGNLFAASTGTFISEVSPRGLVTTYASGLPGDVLYLADPSTASVPEPTGFMLAGITTVSLLRRKSRAVKQH